MVNIKSSKKRILINKFRNKINKIKKSKLKTYIKKVKFFINKKDKKLALKNFFILQSLLDRYSVKNVIHVNKSSRYKSRLLKSINNI